MKKNFVLTIICTFIMLPLNVYAECSQEEINNFKEIEKEYKFTYEMDTNTKKYTAKFYMPELDKYVILLDGIDNSKCQETGSNEYECYDIEPGNYKLLYVSITNTCNDILKETDISLSEYNKYRDDPLCSGIEEFVLCQPTYDKQIDYDTFVSRVNTYKKTKTESQVEIIEVEENNNEIIEFIKNNIANIIVVISFIVLVIITIILTTNSIKESRRLE